MRTKNKKPNYNCTYVNGYWQPMGLGAKLGPKFLASFDAGRWANKHWGLGNWTLRFISLKIEDNAS